MQQNNQKNRIIIILLVCAFVCSVLAGFMIWSYMTPSLSTIYVFNDDYSEGTAVTSDLLTPLQVDSSVISNGATDSIDNYLVTSNDYAEIIRSGDYLRMDVTEGMPLTAGMLSVQGGSTLEMNMTSDAIAVSLSVDQFSGVTNALKTGARVNVYSVMNSEVKLIQQNKRILEVFTDDGALTGIALEENIYESMELIYAINYGSIYLGLVDASGYQSSEGDDPVYAGGSYAYITEDGYTYPETEYEEETEETEDMEEVAVGLGLDFMDEVDEEAVEEETDAEEDNDSAVFTP